MVLVSYSRIYNGVHYPGDVIVAAILGILIGWIIYKILYYHRIKTLINKQYECIYIIYFSNNRVFRRSILADF